MANMAEQTLFSRAVAQQLPEAIPTLLDRMHDFSIGKVLTYGKKPRKLMPWRKHNLNFTGWSLSSLLAEGQDLRFVMATSHIIDAGKGIKDVDVQLCLDGELKEALIKLDSRLQSEKDKKMCVVADFGRITHVSTDLFPVLNSRTYKVNMDHPVVKEAVGNGSALFVITAIYEAEHCNMQLNTTATPSGSGTVDDSNQGLLSDSGSGLCELAVASYDQPAPIAYLLLRLVIGPNGELMPKLNTRIKESIKKRVKVSGSGVIDPTTVPVPQISSTASLDFSGWVVIDIAKEEKQKQATSPTESPKEPPADAPKLEPVHEQAVMVKQEPLGAAPPPQEDEPDSPDLHYIYSLKDFQAFTSSTYEGVVKESQEWVEPIVSKKDLQKAFKDYIKPPSIIEKVQKLSEYLQEYGNALRTHTEPPKSSDPSFTSILNALSTEWEARLDEVTAMLVTTEACVEFPQHTIKKMIALEEEKRAILLELITKTPYGTSVHVYLDEGPFNDPDLYPIMIYAGFSSKNKKLVYTSPDDTEADILAAASVVLEAFSTK